MGLLVQDLPVSDGEVGNGIGIGPVFYRKAGENQLRGGSAYVDANRVQGSPMACDLL